MCVPFAVSALSVVVPLEEWDLVVCMCVCVCV